MGAFGTGTVPKSGVRFSHSPLQSGWLFLFLQYEGCCENPILYLGKIFCASVEGARFSARLLMCMEDVQTCQCVCLCFGRISSVAFVSLNACAVSVVNGWMLALFPLCLPVQFYFQTGPGWSFANSHFSPSGGCQVIAKVLPTCTATSAPVVAVRQLIAKVLPTCTQSLQPQWWQSNRSWPTFYLHVHSNFSPSGGYQTGDSKVVPTCTQ